MAALSLAGCSDDENGNGGNGGNGGSGEGGNPSGGDLTEILFEDGTQIGDGRQEFEIKGDYTLPKGTYLLKGWCYIADGASLTLAPGTIIKGDKETKAALIVEPGGQLWAKGTQSEPIVFTSEMPAGNRRPGDWGGIILCGRGVNNKGTMQIEGGPRTTHGGSDNADCSGALSYVRCEFAGYPFKEDQEINAITFGSVGSATQIDHVQVSYSNDDSYEWFGGAVNAKYLISYHTWDDDFDTDNGFCGKVQFCLGVRQPRIADTSASNGFESDNNASGSTSSPFTSAVFSNVTFIGPKAVDASFQNNSDYINGGSVYPNNGSSLGRFQAAMHIRRNSHLNCFNSVAVGWPIGLILDNEKGDTQGAATAGTLKLNNIWFAGMDVLGTDFNKIYEDGLYDYETGTVDNTKNSFAHTFFELAANNNRHFDSADGWFDRTGYIPSAGSPLIGAASFTEAILNGCTAVDYIGAFAAGDTWLDGWTNFDPQNADY